MTLKVKYPVKHMESLRNQKLWLSANKPCNTTGTAKEKYDKLKNAILDDALEALG